MSSIESMGEYKKNTEQQYRVKESAIELAVNSRSVGGLWEGRGLK